MNKTHDEIMTQDGFKLINRKRRRLTRPMVNPAKIQRTENITNLIGSDEHCILAVENAERSIQSFLAEYMQSFIDALRLAIDTSKNVLLIRAIGIGNFCERNSDSSLQMAVLKHIYVEFGRPRCFYQEPRYTASELNYLQSNEINVLPADSLEEVPAQIVGAMKGKPKSTCLIFMIHFDHFGFERVLKSFEHLNIDHRLVFIANEVPVDYKGELQNKLSKFNIEPLHLPPKPAQNSGNQRDKCFMWWRKAFANTCIYSQKDCT